MRQTKSSEMIILLTVLVTLGFVFGALAEPELSSENDGKINLGTTTEGQLKKGTFTVTNSGDSRLTIDHYMTNCSCVEITSGAPSNLDPGESGEFKFVFDTTGLGGKESKKEVILSTNAPESPHRISVSTQVKPKKTYQTESEEIIDGFALLVDVRSNEKYSRSHILGATNVPEEDFSDWIKNLPEGLKVYVYSQEGKISDRLVEKLDSEHPVKLKSLVGGYIQWELTHESYLEEGSG